MVEISNEKHKFVVRLGSGESVQVYINGSPTSKVNFTVGVGNIANVIFEYNEQESIE